MNSLFDVTVTAVGFMTHARNMNSYYSVHVDVSHGNSTRKLQALCVDVGGIFHLTEGTDVVDERDIFYSTKQRESFIREMDNAIHTWNHMTFARFAKAAPESILAQADMTRFISGVCGEA